MRIEQQVRRLLDLGVPALAGMDETTFLALAEDLPAAPDPAQPVERALVVVHPDLVPASRLAGLLARAGKPGFVVVDMPDLDQFVPAEGVELPKRDLYLIAEVDRGDDMLNWSPEEAAPEIARRGRTPLTVSEGISWLLQHPERLEPNHCFMCISSRKPTPTGFDARTPAIWISGGTGRDGKERRGAPKVGWCWWRNRHTWLGFASAARRLA